MDINSTRAFTTKYSGLSRRLRNKIKINNEGAISRELEALWDTGATKTCISKEVAAEIGLVKIGEAEMSSASETVITSVYCADVILPNSVVVPDVEIFEANLSPQGIDALIGMDIITLGDFSISNYDGVTIFTFRTPSQKPTDYVQQINAQKVIGKTHGQGKRKRK